MTSKRASAFRTVMAIAMIVVVAGCNASSESPRAAAEASKVGGAATDPSPETFSMAGLGDFPEFPAGPLPASVATALQEVVDAAVQGTVRGLTAAVIVGDSGSWSGAAGDDRDGERLTPDTRLPTASSSKSVTAAQILRLVDEGELDLDDPVADHFPPDIAFADTNDATIRDVIGMRSGIPDPPNYIADVDNGSTVAELLKHTLEPSFPAGSEIEYANINFVLAGKIIEHVTRRSFARALGTGVLSSPSLDGLVYGEKSALAADGWKVRTTAASLARWGYELYGGFVVSDDSLYEMTDFRGDWYGLGTIDFGNGTESIAGFDMAAVGHGGAGTSIVVLLVAFPEEEVVVAVQANGYSLGVLGALVAALRDAAQP
jgi:CubicO group peptidase (beta-lactamase class C family)